MAVKKKEYNSYVDEWNSGNWNDTSYRNWSKPTQTGVNTTNVRGSSGTGTYSVTPTFNNPVATTNNLGLRALNTIANKKKSQPASTVGNTALAGINGGLTAPAVVANRTPTGGGGGGGYGFIPTYNPYARYNSPYQPQIDALMNALLNRGPFNYDYLSDPTYQSYRQQYEFQGDRRRENAIGEYARNTGGLASSWATTAGQLRQNNYNAQLNGLIPELENARYNRYLGEIETDFNNLSQLQNLENRNYNRYLNERDYDLQLQQLRNSGLASRARSANSANKQTSKSDLDYGVYLRAQEFLKTGNMPDTTGTGFGPSDVYAMVNTMGGGTGGAGGTAGVGGTGNLGVGGGSTGNASNTSNKSNVDWARELERLRKMGISTY